MIRLIAAVVGVGFALAFDRLSLRAEGHSTHWWLCKLGVFASGVFAIAMLAEAVGVLAIADRTYR